MEKQVTKIVLHLEKNTNVSSTNDERLNRNTKIDKIYNFLENQAEKKFLPAKLRPRLLSVMMAMVIEIKPPITFTFHILFQRLS